MSISELLGFDTAAESDDTPSSDSDVSPSPESDNSHSPESDSPSDVGDDSLSERDCVTVTVDKEETTGAPPVSPAPHEPKELTQREYARRASRDNDQYRRVRVRYTNLCYVHPRTCCPPHGRPVLYLAEGAENWDGMPVHLFTGQVVTVDSGDLAGQWVVVAILWVMCLNPAS